MDTQLKTTTAPSPESITSKQFTREGQGSKSPSRVDNWLLVDSILFRPIGLFGGRKHLLRDHVCIACVVPRTQHSSFYLMALNFFLSFFLSCSQNPRGTNHSAIISSYFLYFFCGIYYSHSPPMQHRDPLCQVLNFHAHLEVKDCPLAGIVAVIREGLPF